MPQIIRKFHYVLKNHLMCYYSVLFYQQEQIETKV